MSRTIPGRYSEPKPCTDGGDTTGSLALTPRPDGCARRADQTASSKLTLSRMLRATASRTRRDAGDAVDSGSVGGIVRDMDVAHEAYTDVLAAVPPTDPGAAAAPTEAR